MQKCRSPRAARACAWLPLALLVVAAPSGTYAAEKGARVAILPGAHGEADPAEVYQEVARSAGLHLGLELVPYNQLLVEGPEPLAGAVRACASDVACRGRALASHELDLGLRAIVNFAIDPPLVSLSVVNASPPRVLTESLSELAGDTTLAEVLRREAATLLDRTGFPRAGRITVSVRPVDAILHVEGAKESEQPGVFIVPAGRWEVRAERAGYTPAQATVEVAAGAEAPLALVLEERPGVTSSPWFWAAVGVAAAAIATTTVLVATDPFAAPPSTGCVCITTSAGGCTPCP